MKEKPGVSVTYVITLDLAKAKQLREGLLDRGFSLSQPPHTLFSGKKEGITCVLYESGKLVVQGNKRTEFIEFYLEPEILGAFGPAEIETDRNGRMGIDESGKGDFFGPLCIAGVYAEGSAIQELRKIGVRDSKTITDEGIAVLARKIRQCCRHHIVRISPSKYNQLYADFKNLNRLLAWGHATAIEALAAETGCQNVIIDQFASEEVVQRALARKKLTLTLIQRHRAEEDLVVAAASILARHAFLEGLARLSDEVGLRLPKGASAQVRAAGRQLVAKHGPAILDKVAKTHFKTAQEIVE